MMITMADPLKSGRTKDIVVKVDDDGCFICVSHSPKHDGRYYEVKRDSKKMMLHRYVYESYNGEIPEGMIVRHTCDNALCINPEHLIVGTHEDNVRDMIERGRLAKGERISSTTLTSEDVLEIRRLLDLGNTQTSIANIYNVDQGTISNIKRGKYWSHCK